MNLLEKLSEIEDRDKIIIPLHFKLSHKIETKGKPISHVKIDFYNANSCKIHSFYRPISKIVNKSN
jgi:hypothetical protein